MEVLCTTKIRIEGSKDTLQAIADMINEEGGLDSRIFDAANLCGDDYYYGDRGDAVVLEQDGRYVLSLWVSVVEWIDYDDWVNPGFPIGVYFELHAADYHWTNDINRRHFTHPYFIVVDDEQGYAEAEFLTEAEAEEFTKGREVMENWYTTIRAACPPTTTKVIRCITNAIRDYTYPSK